MPGSEPVTAGGVTPDERRGRWLALLSLVVLVPTAMAAAGWRDLGEVRRTRELRAVDVAAGASADYNGARIALAGLDVMPPTPGVPSDRNFVRVRLAVTRRQAGHGWDDCRQHLVDPAGRAWTAIDLPPGEIERAFAKAGEPEGASCAAFALAGPKPDAGFIDSYYLVPRAVIPTLRATFGVSGGLPVYLRLQPKAAR